MTAKSAADLKADIAADLADNATGDISPADVRKQLNNMVDSMPSIGGDNVYALEDTIYWKFTTKVFPSNAATTLVSGAVEVWEDNGATPITAGETLTADFQSKTGLNHLEIAATAANGYESGKSYAAYLSAGTVGGISVANTVIFQFRVS